MTVVSIYLPVIQSQSFEEEMLQASIGEGGFAHRMRKPPFAEFGSKHLIFVGQDSCKLAPCKLQALIY